MGEDGLVGMEEKVNFKVITSDCETRILNGLHT